MSMEKIQLLVKLFSININYPFRVLHSSFTILISIGTKIELKFQKLKKIIIQITICIYFFPLNYLNY